MGDTTMRFFRVTPRTVQGRNSSGVSALAIMFMPRAPGSRPAPRWPKDPRRHRQTASRQAPGPPRGGACRRQPRVKDRKRAVPGQEDQLARDIRGHRLAPAAVLHRQHHPRIQRADRVVRDHRGTRDQVQDRRIGAQAVAHLIGDIALGQHGRDRKGGAGLALHQPLEGAFVVGAGIFGEGLPQRDLDRLDGARVEPSWKCFCAAIAAGMLSPSVA